MRSSRGLQNAKFQERLLLSLRYVGLCHLKSEAPEKTNKNIIKYIKILKTLLVKAKSDKEKAPHFEQNQNFQMGSLERSVVLKTAKLAAKVLTLMRYDSLEGCVSWCFEDVQAESGFGSKGCHLNVPVGESIFPFTKSVFWFLMFFEYPVFLTSQISPGKNDTTTVKTQRNSYKPIRVESV